MAILLADCREQNGANPHLEVLIAENNRHNSKLPVNNGGGDIELMIEQITIGDYCILSGATVNEAKKPVVIFERKTWKDLAASIKDGRIDSQGKRLAELKKNGCRVYYIIEGKNSFTNTTKIGGIPFANLHAKIRHGLLKGFPYIQTKDQQHTAFTLVNFTRDIMKLMATGKLRTPRTPLENCLSDISSFQEKYKSILDTAALAQIDNLKKNITEAAASATTTTTGGASAETENIIPTELKTRKINKHIDIHRKIWTLADGVSVITANVLMEKYNIFDVIRSTNKDDLCMELAAVQYDSGVKLGIKKAASIMKVADMDADVLACIPGISQETAGVITAVYSLEDICNGHVSDESIANLRYSQRENSQRENRKIGQAVANKIMDIVFSII